MGGKMDLSKVVIVGGTVVVWAVVMTGLLLLPFVVPLFSDSRTLVAIIYVRGSCLAGVSILIALLGIAALIIRGDSDYE